MPNLRTNKGSSAIIMAVSDLDKMSTVLVTGAAGYIGSHMSLLLLEQGYKVVGIDNMSRGSELAIDTLSAFPSFEFEHVELMDSMAVEEVFAERNFDVVMHFADLAFVRESMKLPELYREGTVDKVKNIVEAMKRHQVPTLLYSSSCAVYGTADAEDGADKLSIR